MNQVTQYNCATYALPIIFYGAAVNHERQQQHSDLLRAALAVFGYLVKHQQPQLYSLAVDSLISGPQHFQRVGWSYNITI